MGVGKVIASSHIDFWEWLWNVKPPPTKVPFEAPAPGNQKSKKHNQPGPPASPPPLDVEELDEDDLAEARRQIRKIARTLVTKMSAQRKRTKKHSQIDLRRTIKRSISTNGIPIDLKFRTKPTKKSRLIVILDTSGSMTEYDVMLLQILQAIRLELANFELFIFATDIEYVTKDVKRDWHETLNNLRKRRSWYGGTNILKALHDLYDLHGKLLTSTTTVLMLSDMESGNSQAGALIAKDIKRRVKNFYIFNVIAKPDQPDEYYERYRREYVEPFEEVVTRVFTTSTLEQMSQAVSKICLR